MKFYYLLQNNFHDFTDDIPGLVRHTHTLTHTVRIYIQYIIFMEFLLFSDYKQNELVCCFACCGTQSEMGLNKIDVTILIKDNIKCVCLNLYRNRILCTYR